ncbi:hypothetical protein F5877DRAFT_54926, partial [Lentinula edodes]
QLYNKFKKEQSKHYRHEPVPTLKHNSPFLGRPDKLWLFCEAIEEFDYAKVILVNYYLRSEEWENRDYPTFEIIPSGRRGTKELHIDLSYTIWFPRAIQWGQYPHIMNHLLFSNT